jgi:metallo-beta-lactamase class B
MCSVVRSTGGKRVYTRSRRTAKKLILKACKRRPVRNQPESLKMKLNIIALGAFFFAGGCGPAAVYAQVPADTAEAHLALAKAAARQDFTALYNSLCVEAKPPTAPSRAPGAPPPPPPVSEWHVAPAKVFDNLYFVGSKPVSAWAVTTSQGIILIDALFDWSVEDEIVNGLRTLGLDPAKIKYVIVTHGHSDHSAGARYLQEHFGARIIMSATDWDYMEKDRNQIKPKRDMVATDGQKLTLGDETITLYLTPGHTPGTLSLLVPLRDGGQQHLGAMYGGTGFNFQWSSEAFRIYADSAQRFRDIVAKAPVDVLLTNHQQYSRTLEKIAMLPSRQPGSANPFVVGNDSMQRYLQVAGECARVQQARTASSSKP